MDDGGFVAAWIGIESRCCAARGIFLVCDQRDFSEHNFGIEIS